MTRRIGGPPPGARNARERTAHEGRGRAAHEGRERGTDERRERAARERRERGLLERVEVRESAIHGRGVFARRRLRRGQRIGRFEGEPTRRNGTYVLWLIDEDGRETGIRGRNALRFLNHGRPANAEFRDDALYALRDIQPGAELLIDYGEAYTD
jgi:hypothetical protein